MFSGMLLVQIGHTVVQFMESGTYSNRFMPIVVTLKREKESLDSYKCLGIRFLVVRLLWCCKCPVYILTRNASLK